MLFLIHPLLLPPSSLLHRYVYVSSQPSRVTLTLSQGCPWRLAWLTWRDVTLILHCSGHLCASSDSDRNQRLEVNQAIVKVLPHLLTAGWYHGDCPCVRFGLQLDGREIGRCTSKVVLGAAEDLYQPPPLPWYVPPCCCKRPPRCRYGFVGDFNDEQHCNVLWWVLYPSFFSLPCIVVWSLFCCSID